MTCCEELDSSISVDIASSFVSNETTLNSPDDAKFGMVLINIASIRHKIDELSLFLEELDFPQLVAITEHWLKELEPIFLENYFTVARYDRPSSPHGGSLILARDSTFTLVDKYNYLLAEHFFEFTIVYSKIMDLYIICIYRSPSSDIQKFLQHLLNLLDLLPIKSKIILCGDFNIDFADICDVQRSLLSIFDSFGLSMHVNSPTRITKSSSTTIDYVVSNFPSDSIKSNVISAGLSDHEAIFTEFIAPRSHSRQSRHWGRIYSKSNFTKFHNLCLTSDWSITPGNVDSNFKFLLDKIISAFNLAFPLRPIKPKRHKPWASIGIRTSAKNMRSLLYIKKFTDNIQVLDYISKYKRTYLKVKKTAKNAYYFDRIANSKNASKETWSIINDLRNKSESPINDLPHPNDLNDYFVNVCNTITSKLVPNQDPLSFLPTSKNIASSFFLEPVEKHELIQTIKDIKNKSSCGTDGLSVKIFLNLPDIVINTLVLLINESFENGVFPDCLKTAIILPLHKGGDKSSTSNYRPIALLPVLSKIIEKLMKLRLLTFLSNYNILSSHQFGFQSKKNTTDAMFSMLSNIYSSLNNKQFTATVFCDYAKAFDCVNHQILLNKLEFYGIRGIPLIWFQSYLGSRKQFVRTNICNSVCKSISSGVPQGSVLGPVLFLLFINDISYLKISGRITLFADDTSITWSNPNSSSLHSEITNDLGMIKSWSDANLLCFNVEKTVALFYRGNSQQLFLQNDAIKIVDSVKFLGLHIDNNLKFSPHVDVLTKKLSSACFAIKSISKELNSASSRIAYFALFESHLRYGLPFWGSCSQSQLDIILKLQKRAIRYMYGLNKRVHCKPYFKKYRILTLPALFLLESVCLIRKYLHAAPSLPQHGYSTRISAHHVRLPIPSSELIKKSLIYNGKKIYNHLPEGLKTITPLANFRKQTKSYFLDRPYYSIEEYYLEHSQIVLTT